MTILRADVWPAVLLVCSTFAVAFTAWRCGNALVGGAGRPAHRAVAVLVCGLGEMVAVTQLLGLVGLLSRVPIVVVALAGAAAAERFVPAARVRVAPWGSRALGGLVVVAACAAILAFTVFAGLRGRSAESDTMQYHAPNAGHWVHEHDLWSLPFSDAGYFTNAYPSNGELGGVWLMAPTGSDQLVYAQNVLWAALAIAGAALVAEELGDRPGLGVLAGTALAFSPLVASTQVHSMMTDLVATSGMVAAVGLLLAARRRPDRWAPMLLAGLAAGLSTGSKYTAFVPALLLAVFALVLFSAGARWRALGGLVAGGASLTLLWLVRNWILVGNPIYPQGVTLGGHALFTGGQTPLTVYKTPMLSHLLHLRHGPIATWRHTAWLDLGPMLLLLALGVAAALVLARRNRALGLTGALAVTWFVAYLAVPYTGGGPAGVEFLIGSQLRYALPFAFLAVALAAAALPELVIAALSALCIAWGAWKIKQGPGFRPDLQLTKSLAAEVLVVTAAVTVVCSIVFTAAGRERFQAWPRTRLDLRPPAGAEAGAVRLSRLVALLVVGLLGIVAVAGYLHERPGQATWVEEALAANGIHGTVAVVAVGPVRDLVGKRFTIPLESTGVAGVAGEAPPLTAAQLDARVAQLHAAALAVGLADQAVKPPGYTSPPGWRLLATADGIALWAPPQ